MSDNRCRVLVPVADGSEEIEAVTAIDTLRRAGAEVTVGSVGERVVKASRGVMIAADRLIAECEAESWDLIVLPGGMPGAERLRDSAVLTRLLKFQVSSGKPYAAICAAPAVVLDHYGLLKGRRATCFPTFRFREIPVLEDRVVVDGNCVTSRGPGTALEFSLALVELLFGAKKSAEIRAQMLAAG